MADLETFYGGSQYLSILLAGITLSRGNKRLLDTVIPFNEHLSVLNEDGTITETSSGFTIACDGGAGLDCTLQSSFNNSFKDIEWRASFAGTIGASAAGASNYNAWGIELEDASGNIFAIRLWDNDNGTKRQIIADKGDPLTNEIASVNEDPNNVTLLIRRESGVFRAFFNIGPGGFQELAFNDTIKGEIVSFRIKSRSESNAGNPPGTVTTSNIFLTCDGNAIEVNMYDPTNLPTGEPYHLILNGGPGSRIIKDQLGATVATLDGREGVIMAIVDDAGTNRWVGKRVNVVGERDSLIIQFTEIPLLISEGIPFTMTFCVFDSKGAVSSIYDGANSQLILKFTFSNDELTVDDTIVDGCSTNVIDDETLPYVQLAETEISTVFGFCWSEGFGSDPTADQIFPLEDDFSGNERNSGVVGDADWNFRWKQQQGIQSNATIVAGILNINPTGTWRIRIERGRLWGAYQVDWGAYSRNGAVELRWIFETPNHEVIIFGGSDTLRIVYGGPNQDQGTGFGSGNSIFLRRNGADLRETFRNGSPFAFTSTNSGDVPDIDMQTVGTGAINTSEGLTIKHTTHLGSLVDYIVPDPKRWLMTESGGRDYIIPTETLLTQEIQNIVDDAIVKLALDFQNDADPDAEIGYREDGVGGLEIFGGFGAGATPTEIFSESRTVMEELILERNDFTFSDFGGSVGFDSQKSISVGDGIFTERWNIDQYFDGSGDVSSIVSGKLRIPTNAAGGNVGHRVGHNYSSVGNTDFNISVDIDVIQWANLPGTTFGAAYFWLVIGGNNYILQLERGNTGFDQNFRVEMNTIVTEAASATTDDSGNLRFQRVGTILTAFYQGASDLNEIQLATSNVGTGNLSFVYLASRTLAPSATQSQTVDYDNFIFNVSASEFTEKRVLFKEKLASESQATLLAARKLSDIGLSNTVHESRLRLNASTTFVQNANLFKDFDGVIDSDTWLFSTKINSHNFNGAGATRFVKYDNAQIESPLGTPYCEIDSQGITITGPNLQAQGFLPDQNLSTAIELIPVRIWRELWQGLIINSVDNFFYRWKESGTSIGPVQNDDGFLTLQSENSDQDSLANQSPDYLTEDFAIICGVANNWQLLNDPAANLTVDAKMQLASSLELARERFLNSGNTWNILSFNESGLSLPKFLDEFFFNDESRFMVLRFSDVTYIFGEGSLMAISNTLTNQSITNASLTFINTAAGLLEGKFGAYTPIRTAQFTALIMWDIPAGVYPMELMNFFIDTLNNFNTETLILSAVDFEGEIVLLNGLQLIEFVIGDNTEYKGWVDGLFVTEFERDTIVSNQGSVDELLFNQFDLALPAMVYSTLFRRIVWNTKRLAPGVDFTQTVTINAFSLLANNQEAYLLVTDSKKISTGNIINRIGIRFAGGVLEAFSDDNGVITTSAFGGTEIDLKIDKTGSTISLEIDTGGGFSALDTSTALDDKPLYFAFVITNTNAASAMSANIDTLKLINKSLASGIGINTDIRLDFDMDKVLSYEIYQAETTDPAPFITVTATVPFKEIINSTVRTVMLEPNEFYSWTEADRAVYNDASFTQASPGDTIQELHSLSVDSGFPYDVKPLWRKDFDVVKYAQAAAGKRPDFVEFIFNGKDTIDFDPSGNDALEDTGSQNDRFLHDGNDFWIGAIFQSLGTGTEQTIYDNSQFLNTNVGVSIYLDGTAKTIKFRIRNGSTSFDHDTPAGAYDETIANLLEIEQKGITNIIKINGVVVSTKDITSFTPATGSSSFNLTIGNKGSSGTGSAFEGFLPVLIISRRRIDSDKAEYLRNYMWKQTGVLSTWITSQTPIYNKETFNIVLRFPQILSGSVVLLQAFDVNNNLLKVLDVTEQSFNIPFFKFSDNFNTIDVLNANIWTDESDGGVAAPFIFNDLVLRQSLVSQNLISKTVSTAPDRAGIFYLEALNTVTFPVTPADDVRSMLVVEFGATVFRMGYLKDSGGSLFFKITEVGVGDIISIAISDFINTPLIIKRDEEENLEFIFNSVTEHTIASSTALLTKWYVETEGDTSNNITTDWDEIRYKDTSAGTDITEVQDVNENIDILIDYQQDDDFLEILSTIQETEITNRTRALILFYSERFIGSTINTRRLVIANAGNGAFTQDEIGTWSWTGSNGTDTSELKTTVTDAELDGDFDIEFKVNIKAFPTGTAEGSTLEFKISGATDDAHLRFYNVDSHATFGTFAGIKIFDNLAAPGNETITLEFEVLGEYTVKLSRRSGVCSWSFKTGVFPYQFIIDAADLTTETLVEIIRTTSLLNSSSAIDIDIEFTDINKEKNGEFFLI